jgi:hypothetical protein
MNKLLSIHASMIAWLAGIGIPVSMIFTGWLITSTIESSKLDSEYVKVALGVLAAKEKQADGKPAELTTEDKALRRWAVRLLNKKSPEPFSKDEQEALQEQPGLLRSEWMSPVGLLRLEAGPPISASAVRAMNNPF